MVKTIFETGDNLESLALKAKDWFTTNGVTVPTGASHWQKCSVTRKEIPPGTGVTSLRRYGFNVTTFISHITGDFSKKPQLHNPLNNSNLIIHLGLEWLSDETVKGHKKVLTKCTLCAREEILDYGTLQRMKNSSNKHCRYCRNAGGKEKDLIIYNKFEGFSIQRRTKDTFIYTCNTCNSEVERSHTHVQTTEYITCEKCYPERNFGTRLYTELGYFDSKIEYEAYKILLQFLSPEQVVRQQKYDELFNTNTKHTADFYIPSIPLVLEITSRYNKLGQAYKDTAKWKLSLSNIVKFAYSLKEVEDIVRPLVKACGLNVGNRRNVLRRSTEW